ncbi:hypothetical protein C8R44DRAFT_725057 [Mycena epipterygia]|nr:hypothetical protein C8R44DRAFT_725057 [Mycena epipterygia]
MKAGRQPNTRLLMVSGAWLCVDAWNSEEEKREELKQPMYREELNIEPPLKNGRVPNTTDAQRKRFEAWIIVHRRGVEPLNENCGLVDTTHVPYTPGAGMRRIITNVYTGGESNPVSSLNGNTPKYEDDACTVHHRRRHWKAVVPGYVGVLRNYFRDLEREIDKFKSSPKYRKSEWRGNEGRWTQGLDGAGDARVDLNMNRVDLNMKRMRGLEHEPALDLKRTRDLNLIARTGVQVGSAKLGVEVSGRVGVLAIR